MISVSLLSAILGVSAQLTSAVPVQRRTTPSFTSILAFGDSYTDNGNGAFKISNNTWPANPHYYNGRFSNGPTYIENVATNLSLPLHDYAYGGATSSNALVQGYTGPSSTIAVPSVVEQISSYLSDTPANPPLSSSLVVILAGANDIFFDPNITAAQTVAAIMPSIELLQSHGAQRFLLLNYPDLSQIPYDLYVNNANKTLLASYSAELGTLLQALADGMEGVAFVDLMPLFDKFAFYEEPKMFGFEPLGSYGSCLTGVYMETGSGVVTYCGEEEVERRVFWDEYHPTKKAHQVAAGEVLRVLSGPFG
ncbi:MAG: hypothetical protein M1828_003746 [Chrysothrix sp. TS-e1954]|nr:MAG: hypothetical protein M1828_003746 [Chrysothrix sp. TS-e1954]